MTAFNSRTSQPPRSNSDPIQSSTQPTTFGPKGAPAYGRTPQSELFLLATTGFFGQDKFYESARRSDSRFVELVRQCGEEETWTWLLDFISWLRNDANIRSAAIVAGLEGARKVTELYGDSQCPGFQGPARQLAKAGISRADEVGEAMAYWTSKYGKPVGPIKRALADKLTELNEFTALKYDSDNASFKLADLIRLLHPKPTSPDQSDLFAWIIASQQGPTPAPKSLPMIQTRQMLMATKVEFRRSLMITGGPTLLRSGGLTWEAAAGWLQGPHDAKTWETLIPTMGYMALLRNLRNFDQVGISAQARAVVCGKLASPVEVAKSRQLPMRFFSAMRAVTSYHWHSALSSALDASLASVPALSGRTLVLVDTSSSMAAQMSEHGTLARWDVAALFGVALAVTSPGVELYSYSSGRDQRYAYCMITKRFIPAKGADTASSLVRWASNGYNIGGGTPTAAAMNKLFDGHDRVILLTDEGHDPSAVKVGDAVPTNVPLFTFNLAGYRAAGTPSVASRHTFGGLNDQAFKLVKLTEDGLAGNWPWVTVKESVNG